MLFGAGVVIFTSRAEERGMATNIADIYYRRSLWLLFFGLLHAYLIWAGDILYFYGAAALFLYPLRRLPAKHLLIAGAVVLSLQLPRTILEADSLETMRANSEKGDKAAWAEKLKEVKPDAQQLQRDIENGRGSYWRVFQARAGTVPMIEATYFYRIGFFDTAGMMLIGMGLAKAWLLLGPTPAMTSTL